MYERILVAIDAHPTEENASAIRRTEQIGTLTGAVVHVLHVARGHIIPEDITGGSARLGVWTAEDDPEDADRAALQQLIDGLCAAGVDAHGEMVTATEHDAADVILQRADELGVDLLVLGHQHHRGSRTAERVIHHHPAYSVLLARPPQERR
ncbi:nucleotide-binding universal stress UspA family protein [Geodermatophilus bullaregiensis]|uniref:universal stress protein n=1 Tax=Geodermatophilus bullaregiensis TaxID=1564160 RepID=UPI001957362D|nr:universal stress protein [Geodermatophilus bullaregiensis]MBM7808517.1 nucleotide-binding universal stress UspA family protein [Geodermatophilus bullaregiensis]